MYCDLVADVAERLRAMVRHNIRGRIFLNPFKNLAMASRRYSRSDRIGDLYDLYLYNPAWEGERPKTRWGANTQVEMRELLIEPPGVGEGFKPDEDNHLLSAKVPILLLNATTLNSGRHWRFEAVRMGEPLPDNAEMRRVVEDADKNIRLEQGYFEPREGKPRVTEPQRDFPLALAVAASACVPGLFHPLAISNLYDGITVQLVDGGVADNQGVQGLFDEGCTHLIISDASLQLPDEEKPSGRVPGGGHPLDEHPGRPDPRRAADPRVLAGARVRAHASAQGADRARAGSGRLARRCDHANAGARCTALSSASTRRCRRRSPGCGPTSTSSTTPRRSRSRPTGT